jgi:hypothetical protein
MSSRTIDRRHCSPVRLAQPSRRFPRLTLSERIHPEHGHILSRVPYKPIAPTKRSSSVAVGVVGRAGHVDHDPTTLRRSSSAAFMVNAPSSWRDGRSSANDTRRALARRFDDTGHRQPTSDHRDPP